jgi:hypothetical protein
MALLVQCHIILICNISNAVTAAMHITRGLTDLEDTF